MNRKTIVAFLGCAVLALIGMTGCSNSNDEKQRQQTEQLAAEANRQAGMPSVVNFQERKLMKLIYELRDSEKLVCYAYTQQLDGTPKFLFKTLGFGLPYAVQYSNPERLAGAQGATLPQPEPNGLWMPASAEATWLIAIGPDGKGHPVYV